MSDWPVRPRSRSSLPFVCIFLGAAAVFILLPAEVALLRSIGSDVAMLTGAYGLVGGLLTFTSPILAMLGWSRFVDPKTETGR